MSTEVRPRKDNKPTNPERYTDLILVFNLAFKNENLIYNP